MATMVRSLGLERRLGQAIERRGARDVRIHTAISLVFGQNAVAVE